MERSRPENSLMKRSLASTMIFKTTHRIAKCCAVLVAASLAWAAPSPLHAENTISIDTVAVDPGAAERRDRAGG